MILNHFEIESSFQKKTALGAVFFRGFSKFEKISFFLKKIEKFQNFISFVLDEFLSADINFFFPVKAETSYFSMVRSLCNVDQQIVAFKVPKCPRKVGKSIFVDRFKNRRI